MYIGQGGNATGNVTVTGYESNSEDSSTLNITNGALAIGYTDNSNGTLTVSHGGGVFTSGSDQAGVSVYVGYGSNSTGVLTVTGVDFCSGTHSFMGILGAAAP